MFTENAGYLQFEKNQVSFDSTDEVWPFRIMQQGKTEPIPTIKTKDKTTEEKILFDEDEVYPQIHLLKQNS